MLIIAAFCPPADVVAELREAVEAALIRPAVAEAPRHRWFGNSGSPNTVEAVRDAVISSWAEPILPIVRFGNLTTNDAETVARGLAQAAGRWAPTEVNVARLTMNDPEHPRTIQAQLAGDLAGLTGVAGGVSQRAAEMNYYLDRRLFHPALDLAHLDGFASGPPSGLLDRLASFVGRPWHIDSFSVLRQTFGQATTGFAEVSRIELGGS